MLALSDEPNWSQKKVQFQSVVDTNHTTGLYKTGTQSHNKEMMVRRLERHF